MGPWETDSFYIRKDLIFCLLCLHACMYIESCAHLLYKQMHHMWFRGWNVGVLLRVKAEGRCKKHLDVARTLTVIVGHGWGTAMHVGYIFFSQFSWGQFCGFCSFDWRSCGKGTRVWRKYVPFRTETRFLVYSVRRRDLSRIGSVCQLPDYISNEPRLTHLTPSVLQTCHRFSISYSSFCPAVSSLLNLFFKFVEMLQNSWNHLTSVK